MDPRIRAASNVATDVSLEIGVPAGAVVTVRVRPSGKGMVVPGSMFTVMGVNAVPVIGDTVKESRSFIT